jgi:type II secretory pathway component HofQ
MNNRRLILIVICSVGAMSAMNLCSSSLQAGQPDMTPPPIELGRSNPFEDIPLSQILQEQQANTDPNEPDDPNIVPIEVPDLFIATVMLKFLDAASLQQALTGMTSEYGTIVANKTNNVLIICDTREKVDWIVAEVRKADKTPEQIIIEAVLIDVQITDDEEIGVNWDIMSSKNYDIGYRQNFSLRLGSTIENASTLGNATAFNTEGTGGNFSLISGTVRNIVHLLQETKNVEILASPKVAVLSGQTASIEAIEEIPYRELTETSMGGELASVAFKEVGVKMQVTATITDSNEILLDVQPEQNINTSVFGIESIPIIDTRKTQTTLLLKDGEVIVIGGLRRKTRSKIRDQIPILGSLPIVGFLFGQDKIVKKDSELLILLSPHRYKGGPLPAGVKVKYDEMTRTPSPLLDPRKKSVNTERTIDIGGLSAGPKPNAGRK